MPETLDAWVVSLRRVADGERPAATGDAMTPERLVELSAIRQLLVQHGFTTPASILDADPVRLQVFGEHREELEILLLEAEPTTMELLFGPLGWQVLTLDVVEARRHLLLIEFDDARDGEQAWRALMAAGRARCDGAR